MSTKPALILLPGLLCDAAIWRPQLRRFSGSHEILVPDFRGYASIHAMARAVLAMAPERFALAGHSMGGRVAVEIMALAPQRVDRLALMNTGVHDVRPDEGARRQVLVELAQAQGMEALAGEWVPPMVAPHRTGDIDLIEEIVAMVCRATPEIFRRQIRALLNRPRAEPVLSGICCPTHVIGGTLDGWSPMAQLETIAASIPGAVLKAIPDCGHMSPLEAPEAVSDLFAAWLTV